MTGLPQVTVPAGFLGGRYPFGVSFLGGCGRMTRCSAWRTPTSKPHIIVVHRRSL
jgi:hypothetical protein